MHKEYNAEDIKKVQALVAALNALSNNIVNECYAKVELFISPKDEKEAKTRFFIKQRPVMGEDGIEHWQFVARESK